MRYNPVNWYWSIASLGELYSSGAKAVVADTDAAYVAWTEAGGTATPIPDAKTLDEVLVAAGLPVSGLNGPYVPVSVSRRQFFQEAVNQSLITQAEALALFQTGTIPPPLETAISDLPSSEQFAAQLAVLGDQYFYRTDPLVVALGPLMTPAMTSAQLDAFFIAAAAL